MSTNNDGGPAFPVASVCNANGDVQYGVDGMSLRDWFAGKALANPDLVYCLDSGSMHAEDRTATRCYRYADAMLRAREAKQ